LQINEYNSEYEITYEYSHYTDTEQKTTPFGNSVEDSNVTDKLTGRSNNINSATSVKQLGRTNVQCP